MIFLLYVIFVVFAERILPAIMIMYGASYMPWSNEYNFRTFYKNYKIISWPRSLIMLLLLLMLFLEQFVIKNDITSILVLIFAILFCVAVITDVFSARKKLY